MYEKADAITHMFSEIESRGLVYCVWKGVIKIEEVHAGTEDLDVLVAVSDLSQFVETLTKHQYFEITKPWCKSDIGARDFFKLMPDGKVFHIHVHTLIIFGNGVIRDYHLPVEDRILNHRVWNEQHEMWQAAPDHDRFLFLCRHLVRKKNGLHVPFQPELDALLAHYEQAAPNPDIELGIAPSGKDFLSDNSTHSAIDGSLRKAVKKELQPFRLKYQIWNKLVAFMTLVWMGIARKLGFKSIGQNRFQAGGVMVAFVGIDGSGKSSALERYKRKFSKGIGVVTVSMGSGQSGASFPRQVLFYLLGTKAKFKGHASVRSMANKPDKPKRFPWYYQLWLIICLWEKRSHLRKGLNGVRQGKIVLVDRWLQTQRLDAIDAPRTTRMAQDRLLAKYLARLEKDVFHQLNCIQPALMIVMDVSPENSVKRKPDDLTLERAEKARETLLLIQWNARDTIKIDANAPIPVVDAKIASAINTAISGSGSTRA